MRKSRVHGVPGGPDAPADRERHAAVVLSKTGTNGRRRSKVKIGGVTVLVAKPSQAEVKQNVEFSSRALERANKRLVRPGVRVYPKKGVPLYFADPDRPGVYVRKLDGKIDRGVLEDGAFKVTG